LKDLQKNKEEEAEEFLPYLKSLEKSL